MNIFNVIVAVSSHLTAVLLVRLIFISQQFMMESIVFFRRNDRELKFARTMIFTVEEINRNSELLPDVTLGYRVYNGCGSENLLRATLEAVNGEEQREQGCKRLQALLGHSSSGISQNMNKIIGPFLIPQVAKSG